MGIGPYTTARSGGDDSWMGSRHGVANAHPGTLKASAFTSATGVTGGVVPSGYPVQKDGDLLVPFDSVAGTLAGFVIGDHDVTRGDETCPVLWHGRVVVANLPIDFDAPADAAGFTFA